MDKYQAYELHKNDLQAKNLTPEQYNQALMDLAAELKM